MKQSIKHSKQFEFIEKTLCKTYCEIKKNSRIWHLKTDLFTFSSRRPHISIGYNHKKLQTGKVSSMVKSYEKDKIKLQPSALLMGGNSALLNKSDLKLI